MTFRRFRYLATNVLLKNEANARIAAAEANAALSAQSCELAEQVSFCFTFVQLCFSLFKIILFFLKKIKNITFLACIGR